MDEYRDKDSRYFMKLTEDGTFLNMTEPISKEELGEYYTNGAKRARTLFLASRDLLVKDTDMAGKVLDIFNMLIKNK